MSTTSKAALQQQHRTGIIQHLGMTFDDSEKPSSLQTAIMDHEIQNRQLNLAWYDEWYRERIQRIPVEIASSLTSIDAIAIEVANAASQRCSVSEIAQRLVSQGLVQSSTSSDALDCARAITFGMLGWQSMLFEPVLSTRTLSKIDIADTLGGYMGSSLASSTINYPVFTTTIPELLLGFGLMLPKRNLCISQDSEDMEAFHKVDTITPRSLNAATLKNMAEINFKWVDVMAPHLEFDRETNTVFLYRFPSFCLANLDGTTQEKEKQQKLIFSLAASDRCDRRWASKEEVSHLLKEILLSYRLLFAQDKASRQLFQSIKCCDRASTEKNDPFLNKLCGAGQIDNPNLLPDRDSYRLSKDFPVLRMRLAVLQYQLSGIRPSGWRGIWADKRDMASWYTFWAVILFGGTGVLLGVVQVIFQGIQTFSH